MANKRKDIMEIKQILLLHNKGLSNRKIAKRLGMSRNTVNGYLGQLNSCGESMEQLLAWDEDQLSSMFTQESYIDAGRYGALLEYFPEVLLSSKKTGFTYQKMWEKYKINHTDGYGYTQFLLHYHKWNNTSDATLKLKHKAGENLMVDYTGELLAWVDKNTGELIEVEVFIGCLPASGYLYVEASPSQQKEHFIRSIMNCLNYMGGSPQCLVVDNLKSAVHKASKYEAVANRTLRDMALHYGSVLNPTRPYRPKDKAMVERMVQLVYEQIFFLMQDEIFHSLHELNERIFVLLEQLNNRQYSQLKCSRKELFLSIEQSFLQPLPPEPYQIKHYKRAKVQKTSHVYLSADKHYYSVPYRHIGKHVQVHYSDRIVEVYYKHERIASHLRDRTASGYTTKKDHLPSTHQFYLDWSPTLFIDKAKKIGRRTELYVCRLFDQKGHSEAKFKTAMGIIQLQRQYNAGRIERACQLAMLHPTSSYNRLRNILEKGLDQHPHLFTSHEEDVSHIPTHENIRGPEYFADC